MDTNKLERYPEVRNWFMCLISKLEQAPPTLRVEVKGGELRHSFCSTDPGFAGTSQPKACSPC